MNNKRNLIVIVIIGVLLVSSLESENMGLIALAVIVYVLLIRPSKRNKDDVIDSTDTGPLDVEATDELYRLYSPIIGTYRSTPISMFMKELDKDHITVMSDLEALIQAGRFQQASISDDTLIIKANHKARQKEDHTYSEGSSEIFSLLNELIPMVKNTDVKNALLSIQEDTKLLLSPSFSNEVEQGAMNKFETFYLPKTIEQLAYYKKLLSKPTLTEPQHNAMVSVEGAILSISQILKDYVASVDSQEAFDMEAEAKAIKQMADSDGHHSDFDWRA